MFSSNPYYWLNPFGFPIPIGLGLLIQEYEFYRDFWINYHAKLYYENHTAIHYVKCMNCDQIIVETAFNDHICDYDQYKNFIEDSIDSDVNITNADGNESSSQHIVVDENGNVTPNNYINLDIQTETAKETETDYAQYLLEDVLPETSVTTEDINDVVMSDIYDAENFRCSELVDDHKCDQQEDLQVDKKPRVLCELVIQDAFKDERDTNNKNVKFAAISDKSKLNDAVAAKDNNYISVISHNTVNNPDQEVKLRPLSSFYQCKSCKSVFVSTNSTLHHCRTLCFNSKYNLNNRHKLIRIVIGRKIYQCEFCNFMFLNIQDLLEHLVSHEQNKYFECKECGIRTESVQEISNHWKHSCKLSKILTNACFVCNICKTSHSDLTELKMHKLLHLGSCNPLQTKTTADEKELNLEENTTISKIEERIGEKKYGEDNYKITMFGFQCNACKKTYLNEQDVLLHQICNHLIYKCYSKCKYKFTTRSSIINHKIEFHKKCLMECEFKNCHKVEQSKKKLKSHFKAIHKGVFEKSKNRKRCNICNRYFNWNSFTIHQQLNHNINKFFYCPLCNKYVVITELKAHLRLHPMQEHGVL